MNPGLRTVVCAGALGGWFVQMSCGGAPEAVEPAAQADLGADVEPEAAPRGRSKSERRKRRGDDAEVNRMLEEIGYLPGRELAQDRPLVVAHDLARVMEGVNLVVSAHATEAVLMDMAGEVLHRWSKSFEELWPDYRLRHAWEHPEFWRRVVLLPGGDLILVFEGLGMARLDRDSKVVWSQANRAHHDVKLIGDELFMLHRAFRVVPEINERRPIFEDYVAVLDPATGEERRRISVPRAMVDGSTDHWRLARDSRDPFHTNAVEVLDGSGAERLPALKAGNLLISMRSLSTLAIIDPETERVVWSDELEERFQHDPRLLPNGNILFFSNNARPPSAAVELDPVTHEAVWSYTGPAQDPMFSRTCGAVERLPNGNTLVVGTNQGRCFELAPDGTLVWEYNSPHRTGEQLENVANLMQVQRVPLESLEWLER